MDRRNQQGAVRPLDEDGHSGSARSPLRPEGKSIALIAGSIVLGLLFVVFGAGGDEPPPVEAPESLAAADADDFVATTTTLPPRLSDILPIDMDRLAVVTAADDPKTVLWRPFERYSRSHPLPTNLLDAWIDVAGSSVAFIDIAGTLFAGPLPGDSAVAVDDMVSAARFHPSEPAELAYTASIDGSGPVGLFRTESVPGLLGGIDRSFVTELPATARLLSWDDWGYAIALDTPAAILILDGDGQPVRVLAGTAYTAGGDAIFIDSTGPASAEATTLASLAPTVADATPLIGIVDTTFEPIFLFPGAGAEISNVTISPDGLHIAVTTFTNTAGTSITISDRSEATLRTVRIDAVVQPIGFVGDGNYLAMQDADSRDLVIVDWRTGARHWVTGLPADIVSIHL